MSSLDPKIPRFRSRRASLIAALALVAIALVATWRLTSLSGLPDIGDPFEVAAYADAKVPDDRNAFTLYKQAVARLTTVHDESTFNYSWSTAGDAEKRWLDRHREALELWRSGTDRPEASYLPPGSTRFDTILPVVQEIRSLCRMASLEGSRLESQGDFAGAYVWYKAQLRCSRHCGRKGGLIERLIGIAIHGNASKKVGAWAINPKVDAAMLRKALDDVIVIDAMTPPPSDAIKCEYLTCMNSLDDPNLMTPSLLGSPPVKPFLSPGIQRSVDAFRLVARREPERSRRVIRLIVANWLTSCDLPPGRQPSVVATKLGLTKDDPRQPFLNGIFAVDAPTNARWLPPEELAPWFDSTIYARMWLPTTQGVTNALRRERSVQGAMVITLATELYRRENGKEPASNEDLLGPHLKALPEGFGTKP